MLYNRIKKQKKRVSAAHAVLLAVSFSVLFWSPAAKACELPQTSAELIKEYWVLAAIETMDQYIREMGNFIQLDLEQVAKQEMMIRIGEYKKNIYPSLLTWWQDPDAPDDPYMSTFPALQAIAKQLSVAKVQQTMHIGMFLDARAPNETIRLKQARRLQAMQRYKPSELACQMDSLNTQGGQARAYRMSRALTRTIASVDTKRRNHYSPEPQETPQLAVAEDPGYSLIRPAHAVQRRPLGSGVSGDLINEFQDYLRFYCDPNVGDQGCTVPGTMPGMHTDIPSLLWGDKQTINCMAEDGRQLVTSALRTLISPMIPPSIPRQVLSSSKGREEFMRRRGRDARLNAIYNVMSLMLTERCGGGTGADTEALRVAAGLPAPDADTKVVAEAGHSSYSEVRDALARARVMNPEYIVQLVNEPETIMRELVTTKAIQNQVMSDLYRRMEEMVFMEAAVYAHELDIWQKEYGIAVPRGGK